MTPPPQVTLDSFDFVNKPQIAEPGIPDPNKKLTRDEKREKKKFIDTMMYGLSAPMVFSAGGWGEDFPKNQIERANILRLAMCSKCIEEQMCTKFDAMAYLNTASMEAPFDHEWYRIYMHTFREALPKEYKLLTEDPNIDAKDSDLYENEIESLDRLRRWIFKKQVNNLK